MRLARIETDPDLAPLVGAVWLCADPQGALIGEPLGVTPHTGTVLCVQFDGDVETEFADRRPRASLTGLQSRVRRFTPRGVARTLMIFLTPRGVARLFPGLGDGVADDLVDLAALVGDREADRLGRHAAAVPDEMAIGAEIGRWLRQRLSRVAEIPDLDRLASTAALLRREGASVEAAARRTSLSVRTLERLFHAHLGLGPKRFQGLHRLQGSLHAALTGKGDPLAGYADQAHQIRVWRDYLGFTPGQMARRGVSLVGYRFLAEASGRGDAFAHYL